MPNDEARADEAEVQAENLTEAQRRMAESDYWQSLERSAGYDEN